MLLTFTANAATGDGSMLMVDSINISGNQLSQLSQKVELSVCNPSDEDYEGHFYLITYDRADESLTLCVDTLVAIEAYSSLQLLLYPRLPEGKLELRLTTDAEGQQVIASCEVTILPLRKLDFQASISLDMLTETDGEAVLYGSRIRGWASIENHDAHYYGAYGGTAADDGIVLWLEDRDSGERLFTQHLTDELKRLEKFETIIAYDAVFCDGARYALKIGYGMPYGLEPVDSLCFTTRAGTNTYWTAEGQVLPLPVGDDQQLMVPEEAVAVDLRGQQAINTVFSIDASQANPNCLYYLDLLDNIPEGLDDSRNIVHGLEAKNIKVVEEHDFFCPLAFHTQFISYMMTPSYDNPDDELRGRGYSETLVLPFYPIRANLYDINGETEMLHAGMLKVLRYYGNAGDSLNIEQLNSISQMHAYEPYILGVYIGSQLLFIGEDTMVPMTREAIVRGENVNFVGTTVARQLSVPTYQYNADDNHFYPSTARIAPFRAYMDTGDGTMSADFLSFSDEVWGTQGKPSDATAISELPQRENEGATPPVYSLSGQRVSVVHANAKASLKKGIYIVGGRKVVVK